MLAAIDRHSSRRNSSVSCTLEVLQYHSAGHWINCKEVCKWIQSHGFSLSVRFEFVSCLLDSINAACICHTAQPHSTLCCGRNFLSLVVSQHSLCLFCVFVFFFLLLSFAYLNFLWFCGGYIFHTFTRQRHIFIHKGIMCLKRVSSVGGGGTSLYIYTIAISHFFARSFFISSLCLSANKLNTILFGRVCVCLSVFFIVSRVYVCVCG